MVELHNYTTCSTIDNVMAFMYTFCGYCEYMDNCKTKSMNAWLFLIEAVNLQGFGSCQIRTGTTTTNEIKKAKKSSMYFKEGEIVSHVAVSIINTEENIAYCSITQCQIATTSTQNT